MFSSATAGTSASPKVMQARQRTILPFSRSRSKNTLRLFGLLTAVAIVILYGSSHTLRVSRVNRWDSEGYWRPTRPVKATALWSYIPGLSSTSATFGERQSWIWANSQRKAGYRRPSWGGLREVGPKASLRTNLKPELKYLTGTPINGWNNQVIEHMNSIYITLLAGRIPVINLFYAHHGHMGKTDDPLAFTEVFDLTSLVEEWQRPVVDAIELKVDGSTAPRHHTVLYDGENPQRGPDGRRLVVGDIIEAEDPEPDHVDCWSTSLVLGGQDFYEYNVHEPITHTYTPLPKSVDPFNNLHRFSGPIIAEVISNYSVEGASLPLNTIARMAELERTTRISPTDNYACLDRTYMICEDPMERDMFQDWRAGLGAWKAVGRHMKFQPGLQRIADDFLRHTLDLGWDQPLPPYLAVHIRRGDMYDIIKSVTQRQWLWRAHQMLEKYYKERGVKISHVIFTTDEQDAAWLKELDLPGWYHVNHMATQTGEKLGYWWPTLIDSALLSQADAFLGIASSTMSILASKRVEDANGLIDFIYHPHEQVPADWNFEI